MSSAIIILLMFGKCQNKFYADMCQNTIQSLCHALIVHKGIHAMSLLVQLTAIKLHLQLLVGEFSDPLLPL